MKEFLMYGGVIFMLVCLLVEIRRGLADPVEPATDGETAQALAWRKRCSDEQRRADQWRSLFERQRCIEELSVSAQKHEQFDIDRHARALGFNVNHTRRAEP